jgi:hypothetical protein
MGPRKSGADSVGLKGLRDEEPLRFIGDGLHDVDLVAQDIGHDDGSDNLISRRRSLVLLACTALHQSNQCLEKHDGVPLEVHHYAPRSALPH